MKINFFQLNSRKILVNLNEKLKNLSPTPNSEFRKLCHACVATKSIKFKVNGFKIPTFLSLILFGV